MFTSQELLKFSKNSKKIISTVAEFIKKEHGNVSKSDIEEKGLNDLVSYVDRNAEEQLVKGLKLIIPKATFVTEESTIENKRSEYYWVIDPLDGTTNFLHGIPHFSISVALVYQEEPIIGIIHDVMREEVYSAVKGHGAYLNDKSIAVSQSSRILTSVLGIGFPYRKYQHMEKVAASLQYFLKNTRGLRRIGSAALDLAYVAAGRLDGFYEVNLNAWDVAAGICIVREAGGVVQDFSGKGDSLYGKEIIASNPNIAKELQLLINQFYVNL